MITTNTQSPLSKKPCLRKSTKKQKVLGSVKIIKVHSINIMIFHLHITNK